MLLLCVAACDMLTESEINALLSNEMSFEELNSELVGLAPSTSFAIIYGESFVGHEASAEIPCHELSAASDTQKIVVTAVADDTKLLITNEDGNVLRTETLNAAQSSMFRVEIPEQGGLILTLQKGEDNAVSMEINRSTIDLKGWVYVVE